MALPREFSIRDALGYVRHLTRSVQADTRSFGAIFAPWLQFQEGDGSTTPVPPDGAALGQIAGRTIAQGVWVAPANLPLQSVADLDRSIDGQPLDQLSDAQVNVYVQEVLGCVAHTANTLSTDSDLMPLGTRRLVSLLRRILTDAGMDAVFQPDDRRHRLAVKARLDQELSDLFLRGALAGDTAARPFRSRRTTRSTRPAASRKGASLSTFGLPRPAASPS
jgi:phage tail sheath protein FI